MAVSNIKKLFYIYSQQNSRERERKKGNYRDYEFFLVKKESLKNPVKYIFILKLNIFF